MAANAGSAAAATTGCSRTWSPSRPGSPRDDIAVLAVYLPGP